ncbi:MAG: APC family permease [Candidatus Omnitrophota bacterium]
MENGNKNIFRQIKQGIIGKAKNPTDPGVFHKLTLAAFLAWVGLGADGISSSCYGPSEAFYALKGHYYLGIFLAVMTAVTVFVISASYHHIIELFPGGGGGYLVASKLLSPKVGMVSGCALLVDYVLTITTSISSGSDAVFSFLPLSWHPYKLVLAMGVLLLLIILNLRGVKESVLPIVPLFLVFIILHVVVILLTIFSHAGQIPGIVKEATNDFQRSASQIGTWGVMLLLLHAYSLGSGTYTGIEAVSNGLPILRDPKVETGKRTMNYMSVSLAFMAGGLILTYLLVNVKFQPGKTLNAVLFSNVMKNWPASEFFILATLVSEALILLVAAQTGFLDGPRVLSNMAMDGWMPSRFALISDRLVTQNGILLMGVASMILMWLSRGVVSFLLVLYSINVFLTFSLSQLGMVRHWWQVRHKESTWKNKLAINGIGFFLTFFILITVIYVKFNEGGWLTLVVTSSLIVLSLLIKRHYEKTFKLLSRLDELLTLTLPRKDKKEGIQPVDRNAYTAIFLVNGYSGMGLHTLFTAIRHFGSQFKNFIFLQAGIIDAGRFKGAEEIENLEEKIKSDLRKYVELMESHGYHAESDYALGTDVVNVVEELTLKVGQQYPRNVLFTGQLVFPDETIFGRILHNYTAFAIQKRLYYQGIPVVVLPIRV